MDNMPKEDREKYEENKMSGYIADGQKGDYYIQVSVLNGKINIIANNTTQNGM